MRNIQILSTDRLNYKHLLWRHIPKKIEFNADGKGCILIQVSYKALGWSKTIIKFQVSLQYNVKHLPNSEAFKLAVDVKPVSTVDKCSVTTISSCLSYTGPGLHSNMAVLEITMPSGYQPDRASLYQLTSKTNASN